MPKPTNQPRYTVVIQWSEVDGCYIASLPEWHDFAYASAHGDTYEEAAKNAREILELLMEPEPDTTVPFPEPQLYHYPGPAISDTPAGERQIAEASHTKQSA